jgi:hypothetical protein
VLAQCVLFGESAADQQLSVMLAAVSSIFADEFFADADALLPGFRPRPPGGK